jgi:amidase
VAAQVGTVRRVTGATVDRSVWRVVGEPLVAGRADGPLAGRTVAVKDVFAVRGHPVGAGNPRRLAGQRPADGHAAAVRTLLDAGASVAGIAHTDELAYSLSGANGHYGTPPNPAAPDRTCGGSSSGPGSAVALGLADIGLGTDTAGSVRVPASYLGLYGLRTSHGALDRSGMLPLAPSFDTVGWLTRDAATLAATARAALPHARRAPLTRAVVVPALCALAEPAVRSALAPALRSAPAPAVRSALASAVRSAPAPALRAAPAPAIRTSVLPEPSRVPIAPADVRRWCAAFRTVQASEAWSEHGEWITANPGALGADVAARFAVGARTGDDEVTAARRVLADARARLLDLLTPGTALLLPATSTPATPRATPDSPSAARARASTLHLTCLAAIAGAPALSLPLATANGAPIGLSLIAAPGSDLDLTDLAQHHAPPTP